MHRRRPFYTAIFATLLFTTVLTPALLADIYQWEWVDPGDHSLGKQPSATVCPDGAGLTPAPGMDANHRDLTQGYLIGFDFTNADFGNATLTDADLTGANLTDGYFYNATLTNAVFSGATIAGADFRSTTDSGFTRAQFESTDSYTVGVLTGVGLGYNNLTGWNFAEKNLTNADFINATLTGANLTGAAITGADFRSTTDSGFT